MSNVISGFTFSVKIADVTKFLPFYSQKSRLGEIFLKQLWRKNLQTNSVNFANFS